jgi:hypothetical protein
VKKSFSAKTTQIVAHTKSATPIKCVSPESRALVRNLTFVIMKLAYVLMIALPKAVLTRIPVLMVGVALKPVNQSFNARLGARSVLMAIVSPSAFMTATVKQAIAVSTKSAYEYALV